MSQLTHLTRIKRAFFPILLVCLALVALGLFLRKTPQQSGTSAPTTIATGDEKKAESLTTPNSTQDDRISSVAVIILNTAKEQPIELKVGSKLIKIPGPSSWPKDTDNTGDSGQNRFLAGIIDTADVLKSNGFSPVDKYSFVIGGTELNAANTYRVTGTSKPKIDTALDNNFIEGYETPPGEQGIWRSLQFKNIVIRYGQVPSLADFLVSPKVTATPATVTNNEASVKSQQNPMVTSQEKELTLARNEIRQLDSSDPATRSEAITRIVTGDYFVLRDKTDPSIASLIEKTMTDIDPTVRKAALDSLDMWDGEISQQSLSRIALNDQMPDLRIQALNLLADRFSEKAIPTLQQASHDPDVRVMQKAKQLLEDLSR